MNGKTTIRIDSKLSDSLSIIATLQGKNKEELANELLNKGLEPYLKEIERIKFV